MKYKIDECVVTGIVNPQLVIRGWVENSANEIVIKSNDEIIASKEIIKYRSKVTTFNYLISLKRDVHKYEIYFLKNNDITLIKEINTNKCKRVIQKYKQKIKYFFGYITNQTDLVKKNKKIIEKHAINFHDEKKYNQWLEQNEKFNDLCISGYKPLISIVMPVFNVPGEYLSYCIDSILNQTYQNFEICIADDCSTNEDTIATLHKYMKQDNRIKVIFREKNGHISRATNSALELATGEFVGLMDNDDKLEKHALNEVVSALNKDKDIDFIYTDEDKIDMDGNRSDPHFKPDFSIDTLYGGNYICHFSVIRKTLIDKIGGFRVGYEGAQDFDLFLRLTEVTKKIYHIPMVLYHWRMIPGSTAVGGDGAKNYAGEAGKRALEDYFNKKNIRVNIDNFISTNYFVEYLSEEVDSLIVLINNQKTNELMKKKLVKEMFIDENDIKCIDINKYDETKIVSKIKDVASETKQKYVIIMYNVYDIITPDWRNILEGYVQNNHIGFVGGKRMDSRNYVRGSGYFYLDNSIIPFTQITNNLDFGEYGRLIIPIDYSIVDSGIICTNKKNILSLNDNLSYQYSIIDACLLSTISGLNNVFVPQVQFLSSGDPKINTKEDDVLKHKYKNYVDKMYNENLSLKYAFYLPRR